MRAVLLAAALSACTWTQADRATLTLASATIACDALQTTQWAARGWSGVVEDNPVLRGRSAVFVASYFAAAEVGLLTLWHALPSGWRTGLGAASTGIQVKALYTGRHVNQHVCL